jgi:hypothetical protein
VGLSFGLKSRKPGSSLLVFSGIAMCTGKGVLKIKEIVTSIRYFGMTPIARDDRNTLGMVYGKLVDMELGDMNGDGDLDIVLLYFNDEMGQNNIQVIDNKIPQNQSGQM